MHVDDMAARNMDDGSGSAEVRNLQALFGVGKAQKYAEREPGGMRIGRAPGAEIFGAADVMFVPASVNKSFDRGL